MNQVKTADLAAPSTAQPQGKSASGPLVLILAIVAVVIGLPLLLTALLAVGGFFTFALYSAKSEPGRLESSAMSAPVETLSAESIPSDR